MNGLRTRLKAAREKFGLSQNAASKRCGVAQHNWNRYESGKVNVPPYSFIEAVGTGLGIDTNWLLTGKGEMLAPEPATRSARIPLISLVGAGTIEVDTQLAYEDRQEVVIPHMKVPAKAYALKIKGVSMEPGFCEGDIVVVQHEEHPKKGREYVFVADGKTLLKQYFPTKTGIELHSTNHAKPIHVDKHLMAFKILYHIYDWSSRPKR